MLNRWYINNVGELYTVYDIDADDEDQDENEDKELAQPLSDFQGCLATLMSLALNCVT
jgi:hypothetical protein